MPATSSTPGSGPSGEQQITVDHQVHWYPRSAVDALSGRSDYPQTRKDVSGDEVLLVGEGLSQPRVAELTNAIDTHLTQAAAAGVSQVVIGPATLAEVLHLPVSEAVEMLDRIHVSYADAIQTHSPKMLALAALPMQDPDAAVMTLDRAINELGLHGVSLLTVNEGRPLGCAENMRVYERIAELEVPIFLHPGLRSTTQDRTHSPREEIGLSWMYQTALAALDLIDYGVFDALPNLSIVHPHLGGVLPYVAGRVSGVGGSRARQPLEHYLKHNFFVDTAVGTPGALQLAFDTYGIERVLFGSDHPFFSFAEMCQFLVDNLPAEQVRQILSNRVPGLPAPDHLSS